jgi:hypothetical protein
MADVHCWESGPDDEDGCGTLCMLLDDHSGPHEWTREDEITITFHDQVGSRDG